MKSWDGKLKENSSALLLTLGMKFPTGPRRTYKAAT